MIVALGKLIFFLPEVHSLKEKRQILRKILDKTSHRYDVAISEVAFQDIWQRAAVGFAFVGSDWRVLTSLLDDVTRFIEEMDLGTITDRSFELVDF